jgi:hypothetical protein
VRYQICAAVMALTFLFIVVILKPTPDVEEFVMKKRFDRLPPAIRAQYPTPLRKVTEALSGAFLDYSAPSVLFVALAGACCFARRKSLAFAVPVGGLIALYAVVHGAAHHQGVVFVAAITALWIAWPTEQEQRAFSTDERRRTQWVTRGIIALLLSLCVVNIWDSAVAIHREYLYPYSGAEDAAHYLKSVGADQGPIFGFLLGVAGVQAYFDRNILSNVPTAYFHHGLPLDGTRLDEGELRRINPEYILAYTQDPEVMLRDNIPGFRALGYEIVHFSDGYYLYKRGVNARDVYFILRRTHASVSPPAALQLR